MGDPGVSIVIPAHNEEHFLPTTLKIANEARRLFFSSTGLPSEIIVVDNASTDATAAVALANDALVVRHDIRNISSVRNAGVRAANFPIIVAIDADCFLPADSLIKIWEYMKEDHRIGAALGVKVISEKTLNKIVAFIIQSLVVRISGIYGAMFVFRKDVALAIGGFPENRLVAEDSAFAIAMKKYGKQSGKKFGLLKSVQIGTLDRKNIKFHKVPTLIFQVLSAFLGFKQTPAELKFWYDPDR